MLPAVDFLEVEGQVEVFSLAGALWVKEGVADVVVTRGLVELKCLRKEGLGVSRAS